MPGSPASVEPSTAGAALALTLPESAATTRIKAERLYQEVRNMIRQEIGAGQEVPF